MKMESLFAMTQYERLGKKTKRKVLFLNGFLYFFFCKVGFELQTLILKLTGQRCDHRVMVLMWNETCLVVT